jgi:hypothetical protein
MAYKVATPKFHLRVTGDAKVVHARPGTDYPELKQE